MSVIISNLMKTMLLKPELFKLTLNNLLIMTLVSACTSAPSPGPSILPDKEKVTITEKAAAVTNDKKVNDELFNRAVSAMRQNNLLQAEQLFNLFIDQYPEFSGAYINLAIIYFKQQQYDKSRRFTNKAISLNAAQAQAYQLRAQLHILAGKIHQAEADYLMAIKLKPDYIIAHYNLALLYDIYLQDIKRAIQHYDQYLALIKQPDEATRDWANHLRGTITNVQN